MDNRKNKIVAILILSLAIFIYYLQYLDEVNNLNGSYICVLTIILPVFTWPIFLFRQYLLPYKVEGILVSSVLYFLTPEGLYDEQYHNNHELLERLPEPDYEKSESWGAKGVYNFPHGASIVPHTLNEDTKFNENNEKNAKADCFYLHPTTVYVDSTMHYNVPIDDRNGRYIFLDGMLPTQASIFNSVSRIYAPYYREMLGTAYFTENNSSRNMAMNLAYYDVKRAFKHYLKNFGGNKRPIILASHSQGTEHAMRLLKDFFNPATTYGRTLLNRLVVAYLPGMQIYKSVWKKHFPFVDVCKSPSQTHCIVSWNTLAYNDQRYLFQLEPATSMLRQLSSPEDDKENDLPICTNPLSWISEEEEDQCVSREHNKGSYYLLQFRQGLSYLIGKRPTYDRLTHLHPLPLGANVVGACCINGYNRIYQPSMSWPYFLFNAWSAFSFPGGNFHSYDYAFYYHSIRNNVELRWQTFEKENKASLHYVDEGVETGGSETISWYDMFVRL